MFGVNLGGAASESASSNPLASLAAKSPVQIPGFQEESAFDKCCPNLTMQQRIMGFAGCSAFGWVLATIGTFTLIGGPTDKNIQAFACLYVFGNIIALCATGFLLGPKTQCKKMWDPTRRYTTAFYLTMLIIVFAVGAAKQNVGIVIFLLIIEVLAAIWYGASYIPFGRKIIITFLRNTICKPCAVVYDATVGGGGGGGGYAAAGSAA